METISGPNSIRMACLKLKKLYILLAYFAVKDLTQSNVFDDDASEDEEEQNRFGGGKMSRGARLLREFKEVPMTPALEYLMKTRRQKITEEVEDAFGSMGAETKASTNAPGGLRSGVNAAALVDQDALD